MMRLHESVKACDRMIASIDEAVEYGYPVPVNQIVSDLLDVREMLGKLEDAVAILTGVTS